MKTNENIISLCIIALILSLNLVMAFSPISGYSQQNPLFVYPGEEKETSINIYISPGEETISVEAIIIEGMNIASITDKNTIYEASPSKYGVVNIKIKVPSTAAIGLEYNVVTRFVNKTPKPSAGGTVSFNIEATNTFKVVVVEKPPVTEETPKGISSMWLILIIVVVVAIILVLYFMIKRKK